MDIDLTKGVVREHIRRIAVPASIGMLFNTLFNIVDTIYAGNIGTNALAGMSLAFPVFFILLSLAMGIGTGSTALISNALGRKDVRNFHKYGYNAIALGLVVVAIITFFGTRFVAIPLLKILGGEVTTLDYGVAYIRVIFSGSIFVVMNMVLNSMLASQGDTKSYRNVLIISFILNLILDPLFILGWFGLPKMGTAGVALATVIVQMIGTVYMSIRLSKSSAFDLSTFKEQQIDVGTIRDLLKQGVPATLNMMTIAIGIFVIQYFVVRLAGDATVAAYGASSRIVQLALLPAIGLNTAAITMVGQNYGAKIYSRVNESFRVALRYSVGIMIIAMLIIYPLAGFLIRIFNQDPLVIEAGTRYLRIEFFCFTTYSIMNISIATLQGLKRPGIAVYLGLYRQALMPLLLFNLLAYQFNMGVLGVWWGIVIINWTAAIFVLFYTLAILKKVKRELQEVV